MRITNGHGRTLAEMDGRWQTYREWADELRVSVRTLCNNVARGRTLDGRPIQKREAYDGANTLSWDEDVVAKEIVRELGPLNHREIGMILGVTNEMVRKIEVRALAKLRQRFVRDGVSVDVVDALREFANRRQFVYAAAMESE